MGMDKQILGHNQGMAYANKIINECEPGREREALAKEIKFRGLTNVPITVNRKAIDDAIDVIKSNTLQTVLLVSCACLRDEFQFGEKRINKFIIRFNNLSDSLLKDYCSFEDYVEVLKEEIGIDLSIEWQSLSKG